MLIAMVPAAAVVWLVWCGGRWRTAGWVLGHLLVAIAVFSVISTAVAESKSTVCYNGPCTEHMAAVVGGVAVLVLSVMSILAALAAALLHGRGAAEKRPLRLRPWLIACEVLALGVLAAGAVVYGDYLSEVEYDPQWLLSRCSAAATSPIRGMGARPR